MYVTSFTITWYNWVFKHFLLIHTSYKFITYFLISWLLVRLNIYFLSVLEGLTCIKAGEVMNKLVRNMITFQVEEISYMWYKIIINYFYFLFLVKFSDILSSFLNFRWWLCLMSCWECRYSLCFYSLLDLYPYFPPCCL